MGDEALRDPQPDSPVSEADYFAAHAAEGEALVKGEHRLRRGERQQIICGITVSSLVGFIISGITVSSLVSFCSNALNDV